MAKSKNKVVRREAAHQARSVGIGSLMERLALLGFEVERENSKLWLRRAHISLGIPSAGWPVTLINHQGKVTHVYCTWACLEDTLRMEGIKDGKQEKI